jgi:hypothetical protein
MQGAESTSEYNDETKRYDSVELLCIQSNMQPPPHQQKTRVTEQGSGANDGELTGIDAFRRLAGDDVRDGIETVSKRTEVDGVY